MKTALLFLLLAAIGTAPVVAQKPAPPKPAPAAPAAVEVKDVTPDDVQKLVAANKDIIIVDVRTSDEFDMGHIAGAKNVNFLGDDFEKDMRALFGKPIVVHCATGRRSASAVEVLKSKAFPVIYHMSGGYKAWVGAGKPVVGAAAPGK